MTYGEIYTAICKHLWGNSLAPASASIILEGENGVISDCQQKIQNDYNYWFMQAYCIILTIAGQHGYNLPSDFKEIINCLFKQEGTSTFYSPLKAIGLGQGQYIWDGTIGEYANTYEIVDASIVLYPQPTAVRTLNINYWKRFERPALTTVEDPVSTHMAKVLIYMGIIEYSDIMKEWDVSQRYESKLIEELENVRSVDRARRQNHISQVLYRGV